MEEMRGLHARKARQVVEKEGFVCLDVRAHYPQQKVRLAHQRVALEDLGVLTHCLLENFNRASRPWPASFTCENTNTLRPSWLAVEERHAAADDAELAGAGSSAASTSKRSGPNRSATSAGGQIAVVLQDIQDAQVARSSSACISHLATRQKTEQMLHQWATPGKFL